MKIFDFYAQYYDLLYHDKNYASEVEFLQQHLQDLAPQAQSILEFGSGTGIHATLLAQLGYEVHGVDISTEMITKANSRLEQLHPDLAGKLSFSCGDMGSINLGQHFDVAIALFHVMSYQTTNQKLLSALQTAKNHLKPDGILIFDFWYGAAVLSDRPTVRVKRLENNEISLIRIAEPVMDANQNLVEVNYQLLITDKLSHHTQEIKETHHMRYLFLPEIELLLSSIGMEVMKFGEWMSDRPAGFDTWGVYCMAKSSSK
jgi:SAM-dependent methyltransferase